MVSGSRAVAHGYLTFGDIEGKLDILRVEVRSAGAGGGTAWPG